MNKTVEELQEEIKTIAAQQSEAMRQHFALGGYLQRVQEELAAVEAEDAATAAED